MEEGEGTSSTTSAATHPCTPWGLARQRERERERAEGGTRERERNVKGRASWDGTWREEGGTVRWSESEMGEEAERVEGGSGGVEGRSARVGEG
jgi:hypothetical protein